jgi:hypothetical protein
MTTVCWLFIGGAAVHDAHAARNGADPGVRLPAGHRVPGLRAAHGLRRVQRCDKQGAVASAPRLFLPQMQQTPGDHQGLWNLHKVHRAEPEWKRVNLKAFSRFKFGR